MNFQFPDKGNKVGSYIIFIDSVLAFQCDTIMEVSAVMFPLEQHGFMIYVDMQISYWTSSRALLGDINPLCYTFVQTNYSSDYC